MKKKILVRAPSQLDKMVMAFPFFHELHKEFSGEEIHLIVDEEKKEILKFVPTKFTTHLLPLDKRSVAGIHHFVVNTTDVFNIDLFFDLDDSFKSAFMGFNFRGKERVGVNQGLKKFLFNKKIEAPTHPYIDKQYLDRLKVITGKEYDNLKFTPREFIEIVEQIVKHSEILSPDFVLVLADAKSFYENFKLWTSLLSSFEGIGIKISLVGSAEEKRVDEETFLKEMQTWPCFSQLEMIPFEDSSSLIKAIVTTKGVLTDMSWAGQVSSYFGVDSFVFSQKEFNILEGECFVQRPKYVLLSDKAQSIQVDLDRVTQNLEGTEKLIELIHERFRI